MTHRLSTAVLGLALLLPVLLVASGGDPVGLAIDLGRAVGGGAIVAPASGGSGAMDVQSDFCGCETDPGRIYMTRHTAKGDLEVLMPGPTVTGHLHGFLGVATYEWRATRVNAYLGASATGTERGTLVVVPSASDRGQLKCTFRGKLDRQTVKCKGKGGKWKKLRGNLVPFAGCAALQKTCAPGLGPIGLTLDGMLSFRR